MGSDHGVVKGNGFLLGVGGGRAFYLGKNRYQESERRVTEGQRVCLRLVESCPDISGFRCPCL